MIISAWQRRGENDNDCDLHAYRAGVALSVCLLAAVPAQAATETVLHAFKGGKDGAVPEAGLIEMGGKLYGATAVGGGAKYCRQGSGAVCSR